MRNNKHKPANNTDKIRNIPAFLRSYLGSKSGERAMNMRGNNLLAHKFQQLVTK